MDNRTPFADLPLAQQAGILCNDKQFRTFAAHRSGMTGQTFNPTAAAHYLRRACDINSRAHLNTNKDAAMKFAHLRTEFDAWRGKIATPR